MIILLLLLLLLIIIIIIIANETDHEEVYHLEYNVGCSGESTNILEETTALIFRVEETAKQQTYMKQAACRVTLRVCIHSVNI
jgi:hypothetical protein